MPDMAMDYSKICFVVMPFDLKKVGDKDVDFDVISNDILMPVLDAAVFLGVAKDGSQHGQVQREIFNGDLRGLLPVESELSGLKAGLEELDKKLPST